MKNKSLFLIEFYTANGDINFAWVYAADKDDARAKLRTRQGARLSAIIQTGEHSAITPLGGSFRCNTPDANLFIYR